MKHRRIQRWIGLLARAAESGAAENSMRNQTVGMMSRSRSTKAATSDPFRRAAKICSTLYPSLIDQGGGKRRGMNGAADQDKRWRGR